MNLLKEYIRLLVEADFYTKNQQPIDFKVHEQSPDPGDQLGRGWVVHHIEALVEDKPVGYIKISYIPSENFQKEYPTIVQYLDKIEGRSRLAGIPIKQLEKEHGRRFLQFKDFHVDKPLVDYIRVEDSFQRNRIGAVLYEKAARWLAERGLKLYASGIQSDQAIGAWNWLKQNRGANVGQESSLEPSRKTRTFLSYL